MVNKGVFFEEDGNECSVYCSFVVITVVIQCVTLLFDQLKIETDMVFSHKNLQSNVCRTYSFLVYCTVSLYGLFLENEAQF